MTSDNNLTGAEGRVQDATDLNWVDRFAPPLTRPFLRLSRADRPIGTWLLLIPCWWGITLAAIDSGWRWVDLWLFVACAIGAFLMRGAGCTWNDIQDRDIDAEVERTRSRPLPSGQVSLLDASLWLIAQAMFAFVILLTFNTAAIWWGIASLIPVAIYPFAKRFTWWPQAFLGLAFNWGILLMWAAHAGSVSLPAYYLYIAGIAWTLHYDTIYAHQDREDDAIIGVKSTARLFEEDTVLFLWIFTVVFALFALVAVLFSGGGLAGILGVAAMTAFMAWQTRATDIDDPAVCLSVFRATRWGGLMLFGGLLLDSLF
ncbi:4-hydroxybenzoate octaprenyltransferase [Rhodobacteraceae bacterium NNCM2]|nr:4-hydroxybenzoate octaprenyltransferase [Coraliihabitans acroporae]